MITYSKCSWIFEFCFYIVIFAYFAKMKLLIRLLVILLLIVLVTCTGNFDITCTCYSGITCTGNFDITCSCNCVFTCNFADAC